MTKDNNIDFQPLQAGIEEYEKEESFHNLLDKFDQDDDADFSNVKMGGRHFLIKAPKIKRKSGIILSDETRSKVQDLNDMPTFNPEVTVAHAGKDCTLVQKGDMLILSPFTKTLEVVVDNVLYIIIHEDYVIMTKSA